MAMDDEWRRFIARKNVKNIKLIPNGISTFSEPNSNSDFMNVERKKFDLVTRKNVLTIGTISRLQSERKPWLFLQVFAEVQKLMDLEVHFILGGEGPERESLEKLAEQLKLSENLTMLGLIQDPLTVMLSLDLYVSLNVEETTGIAGLEAVFAGVPVVGIQLSQEYSSGKEDWIWSDQNPQVVGREIAKYLSSPKLLQAISKSQLLFANEKYSLNRMREDYLNLYRLAK
jgi:glycosyltransferase involved in cell wall biosynthesis